MVTCPAGDESPCMSSETRKNHQGLMINKISAANAEVFDILLVEWERWSLL
jgi:2-phospho-L-lactate guanylyltransferase (CobY/MobA/RfbA family)